MTVSPAAGHATWASFRAEFPLVEEYAFLNHASVSPLPACVAAAMSETLYWCQYAPKYRQELRSAYEQARSSVATLLHATPDEVAFVPNTATGISLIANGLPLSPGDEVLLTDMEYPANVYPWMNLAQRGIKLRMIPNRRGGLDLDMVQQAVNERTRVVTVSSVQFLSGYRADLAALGAFCRSRGIYFVVDAIQSLGVIPMDVQAYQVDFLAAGAWKWLVGPRGQGLLYCRRDLIEQVHPVLTGAGGVAHEDDYLTYDMSFLPTAERFHIGMPDLTSIIGLGRAVDMLLDLDITRIEQRVLQLIDLAIRELRQRGYRLMCDLEPGRRSGIVSFAVPPGVTPWPDADALFARLEEAKVITSLRWDAQGQRYIRISPHAYNNEDDLAHLFEVLDGH